jgi:N-acetylglutamate synthase-like GNAT family acetyltransferase
VEALLQEPALQGVERVYLMTTNSSGFYEQLGFTAVDSQRLMLRQG